MPSLADLQASAYAGSSSRPACDKARACLPSAPLQATKPTVTVQAERAPPFQSTVVSELSHDMRMQQRHRLEQAPTAKASKRRRRLTLDEAAILAIVLRLLRMPRPRARFCERGTSPGPYLTVARQERSSIRPASISSSEGSSISVKVSLKILGQAVEEECITRGGPGPCFDTPQRGQTPRYRTSTGGTSAHQSTRR